MEVSSHEDSAGDFCYVGSIFSMKLLGFVSKAIKVLLTELVGQCRNILPIAFYALTPFDLSIRKRLRAIYSCTDQPTQLIRVYYYIPKY